MNEKRLQRATTHLWDALEESDPAEKDYHVRSALQRLATVDGDGESAARGRVESGGDDQSSR